MDLFPLKLGVPVKILGNPALKSHDARRWQNSPHLKFSIEYAHTVFDYLEATNISMYRFSSDFAPYLTHPDMPQFHNQLEEAHDEFTRGEIVVEQHDLVQRRARGLEDSGCAGLEIGIGHGQRSLAGAAL